MKAALLSFLLLPLFGCAHQGMVTTSDVFWIEIENSQKSKADGFWYCKGNTDPDKPPVCAQAILKYAK